MIPGGPGRVVAQNNPLAAGHLWRPTIGEEATALIVHKDLPNNAGDAIQQAAAGILGRGQPPRGPDGRRTGLVVGYVQSGKTLSFTTVIALARDNDIPVVIVVAGSAKPLFDQTVGRLIEDLQVGRFAGPPRWIHVSNPDAGNRQIVQTVLDNWRDPTLPREEKATLLITVMKQWQRLDNLNTLLAALDLRGTPAIIVDDEADQASLNTRVQRGEESTTYQRVLALRDHVPHHTFLQYTATPQAPLLINIIDVLSPEFPEVLAPGNGYVGGIDFFSGDRSHVAVIPPQDVPSPQNPITDPPESLLDALRMFFVGVSAGLVNQPWSQRNPNRSMLVHPTRTTAEHFQYFQNIQAIKDDWARILALPEGDADRRELVADLRRAHAGLRPTVGPSLPDFDLVLARLPRDIAATQVREINRRPGNLSRDMQWGQAYAWILVGGQAMDRGFTVRELTVTYMPRGIGTGNADTLQQRARFFGYKRHYLGYCRIYLEADSLVAFEAYVAHEEEMRRELSRVRDRGEPLTNWKRRFILDNALNACRSSVIDQNIVRGNFSDSWFFPRFVKMSEAATAANRQAFEEVFGALPFVLDTTFTQVAQQHAACDQVALERIVAELLLRYRIEDPADTQNALGMLLQISLNLTAGETAAVYRMRPGLVARRGLDANGRITSIGALHQGPTRLPGGGYSYPGDRDFKSQTRVSIQLHTIDLTEKDANGNDVVVRQNVPVMAVWIPSRMSVDWVVQDQA